VGIKSGENPENQEGSPAPRVKTKRQLSLQYAPQGCVPD
jgi:hypothetical protein